MAYLSIFSLVVSQFLYSCQDTVLYKHRYKEWQILIATSSSILQALSSIPVFFKTFGWFLSFLSVKIVKIFYFLFYLFVISWEILSPAFIFLLSLKYLVSFLLHSFPVCLPSLRYWKFLTAITNSGTFQWCCWKLSHHLKVFVFANAWYWQVQMHFWFPGFQGASALVRLLAAHVLLPLKVFC